MKKLRSTHARKLSRTSSETARAVSAAVCIRATARADTAAVPDAATFPDAALRPGPVVRAAWFRADVGAVPVAAIRPTAPIVRTAVSDFAAMVFPLLAAAQSSRRADGTQ